MDRQSTRQRSRLPLPTASTPTSIKPSPSRERLQADPGLNVARLRRPSEDIFKKPLRRPSSPSKALENQNGSKEAPRMWAMYDGSTVQTDGVEIKQYNPETRSDIHPLEHPLAGEQRPSLSDRTIETLSQIPSTPSPRRTS